MPGGFCITDQITDQYAPYCSELRYAVSSDYIELADYWWMQQEMNTLSVRHIYVIKILILNVLYNYKSCHIHFDIQFVNANGEIQF